MINKEVSIKDYVVIINSMIEKNVFNYFNIIENSYNNPYLAKIKNCGNPSKVRPP